MTDLENRLAKVAHVLSLATVKAAAYSVMIDAARLHNVRDVRRFAERRFVTMAGRRERLNRLYLDIFLQLETRRT